MTHAQRLHLFCSRCDGTGKVEDLGLCGVTLPICSLPASHDGDHEGSTGNGVIRWSRGFDGPIRTREVGLPAADLKRKSRIERLAAGWRECWGVHDPADKYWSWVREATSATEGLPVWGHVGRRQEFGTEAAALAEVRDLAFPTPTAVARRFWRRKKPTALDAMRAARDNYHQMYDVLVLERREEATELATQRDALLNAAIKFKKHHGGIGNGYCRTCGAHAGECDPERCSERLLTDAIARIPSVELA